MSPEAENLVAFARAVWLGTVGGILAIAGIAGMLRIDRLGAAAGAVTGAQIGWLCACALVTAVGTVLLIVAGRRLRSLPP